jgi:hypothetical protein
MTDNVRLRAFGYGRNRRYSLGYGENAFVDPIIAGV